MAKNKSLWVEAEWNGPEYSVPVNGGYDLFHKTGRWDYGMHVRGEKFPVLRVDAESDPRFLIISAIPDAVEKIEPIVDDDDDELLEDDVDLSQPPAESSGDHSIPAIAAALSSKKSSPPAKKK